MCWISCKHLISHTGLWNSDLQTLVWYILVFRLQYFTFLCLYKLMSRRGCLHYLCWLAAINWIFSNIHLMTKLTSFEEEQDNTNENKEPQGDGTHMWFTGCNCNITCINAGVKTTSIGCKIWTWCIQCAVVCVNMAVQVFISAARLG